MLNHPTIDQMQALGLIGMAAAYRDLSEQPATRELAREEWLGLMLDRKRPFVPISGCPTAFAPPGCDLPTLRSKTSTSAPTAASTGARCSRWRKGRG